MVFDKLKKYGELVMFSHTLFSLPFALMAMIWAAKGIPSFHTFFWILMALLGARNGANALNRLVDRKIDAKNPRTAGRHLPKGIISVKEVLYLVVFCFGLYLLSAFMLNPLCFILAPIPLAIFILYSYTKRFTWLCHVILGIACGGAPVGAWLAVTGKLSFIPFVIGAAVTLWVGGFDVIYAMQDIDFDRKSGLYSIPSYFGPKLGLLISAMFHLAAVLLLISLYFLLKTGWIYILGVGVIITLLIIEHYFARPTKMRNIKLASYSINQVVSVLFFIFSALDFWL